MRTIKTRQAKMDRTKKESAVAAAASSVSCSCSCAKKVARLDRYYTLLSARLQKMRGDFEKLLYVIGEPQINFKWESRHRDGESTPPNSPSSSDESGEEINEESEVSSDSSDSGSDLDSFVDYDEAYLREDDESEFSV